MLATWQGYHRTMSPNAFRLSIVVAVVAISLLGVIAFATVLAGELTERSVLVLGVILGFLGPTVVALLGILKTDAMGEQVQRKVADIHHDILNGGLRDNVKRAMHEVEADPSVQAQRIDNVAKGVSKDRHAKAQRDTIAQNADHIERLRRERAQRRPEDRA